MEKQCGCFKKSSYEEVQYFDTKDEALKRAKNMCEHMNTSFCEKHNFTYKDNNGEIIIKMEIAK
jgi:hypothetical protein